ncbi:MAG: hypothetical protein JNL11_05570 [Bdellovibrionaceae bacterium]|nr:hypothetical protein [Pseudobdellovibrionaceae bacterium]
MTKGMPKPLEKIFFYFPFFHLLLVAGSGLYFLKNISLTSVGIIIFSTYLVPLILWRLLHGKYPLHKGLSPIGILARDGSSWMVAHRLQYLFLTFSSLEKILILIPGLFSLWLRCWGSHIGKSVVWTPNVRILDRTGLHIGSYSFLGEGTILSCHLIVRKQGKLVLLYDSITMGEKVLLGAHAHIGPGAKIKDQELIPTYSKIMKGRYLKGNGDGYEL